MAKVQKRKRDKQARIVQSQVAQQQGATGSSVNYWPYLLPALVLVILVFGQTLGFDFVNWDDDLNVLENRGVTTFDLKAIWTETVIGNYNPLPITSFAVEHQLVGTDAGLYHATNVLLHLLNVGLVFFLGRRLKLDLLPAALLATLFAIHPMRVESVAWITERKDVMFAAFYLGALLVYERRRQLDNDSSLHWSIVALFALALVSKIQAVSLPLSMLCFDYLRQGKLSKSDVLAKAPYFIMSLLVGLAGIYFLGKDGSLADATDYSLVGRFAVGAYAYTVYLIKAVLPYEMSPLYPYPATLPVQAYASFSVIIAAGASLIIGYLRGWINWVFGLMLFSVNVVFMLQVLGAGQGYLADRFTYVGYLGLFWLMAWGLQMVLRSSSHVRMGVKAGASVYVLVLALLAYQQTKIWQNGGTLWSHVSELYPKAATAWGNHAQYLRELGNSEQAMLLFGKAISADPTSGSYLNSRGKLHFDQGDTPAAIADYSLGIERSPELGELYINRGAAYAKTGNYTAAESDLNRGVELDPKNFNGLLNRSLLYYSTGRYLDALGDYDEMLHRRPERADLWQERGSVRASQGDLAGGIGDLRKAVARAESAELRARYQSILDDLLIQQGQ